MKHGSLFSNIGGFDLAAEMAGFENMFHCEINPFGQQVLKSKWPKAISYGDIKQQCFKEWRGKVDIISGGFPCQDNSNANKSKTRKSGLKGERSSLAWEMLRVVSEIGPSFIVAENVSNILKVNSGEDFRMQNGEFVELQKSVPPIKETGCIWLLTPTASDYKRDKLSFPMYFRRQNRSAGCLTEHLFRLFGAVTGNVNHQLYAWMMGFPEKYLDYRLLSLEKNKLKPTETQ